MRNFILSTLFNSTSIKLAQPMHNRIKHKQTFSLMLICYFIRDFVAQADSENKNNGCANLNYS